MWWRATPQDLHRITDRVSTLYVERTHIDREDNAVVLINKERTVRVPAAFIVVLLLGPGTRITHAAMTLLGDSATGVCWVGEHGVRFYAGGPDPTTSSRLLQRQAELVSHQQRRLAVARAMYQMRFPAEQDAATTATMQQLRGREGARVKRLYRHHSQRTGVPWTGRAYKPGQPFAEGDDVNRALSAANACLYGLCHATIAGIGASPGLGFIHTGTSNAFVTDIADLYKAAYTIPLAFDLAAEQRTDERDVRHAFRNSVKDGQLLKRIIADISTLLDPAHDLDTNEGRNRLWDNLQNTVAGGHNYAPDHQVVTGPELSEGQT